MSRVGGIPGVHPGEDVNTCPVVTEFFGPHPCVEPVSFRLVLHCDHGHVRELLACDFHARVAVEDEPASICRECDEAGSPDVRVRYVSSGPQESEATR